MEEDKRDKRDKREKVYPQLNIDYLKGVLKKLVDSFQIRVAYLFHTDKNFDAQGEYKKMKQLKDEVDEKMNIFIKGGVFEKYPDELRKIQDFILKFESSHVIFMDIQGQMYCKYHHSFSCHHSVRVNEYKKVMAGVISNLIE